MKNLVGSLLFVLFILPLSIIFISCSDSVEPKEENSPYVSLNIGDERQLVFSSDSSTIFYSVAGTANRSDGLQVNSYAWYYGTDTIPEINYYFIKDGFFIATQLDSIKDSLTIIQSNPYNEQRLAKIYPNNGDIWQSISGDSTSYYFLATNIGTQQTFAGSFNNCFSFRLGNFLSVNYAKGIGHIASIFLPDSAMYLSSYIKVKNKIYGSKFPAKNLIYPGVVKNKNSKEIISFLLGKQ